MRVDGRAFDGSTSYLTTAKQLRAVAGHNTTWFSTFTPLCLPHREALYMLMRALLLGGNCCFLSGTFVSNIAWILSGYKGACLYITLSGTYLVRLLFQRVAVPTFSHAGYLFDLLYSVQQDNLYVYRIAKDSFSMRFFVFGVDISARCGPLSNVDFAYFVWDIFESMSAKQ